MPNKYIPKLKKHVYQRKGRASQLSRLKQKSLPISEEAGKFAFEVRRQRVRELKSRKQLAEALGLNYAWLQAVELGQVVRNFKNKVMMERLRLWVETNKPLREREKFDNVDEMFREIKENQDGRTHTQ